MQQLIKHIQSKEIDAAKRRYLAGKTQMPRRDQLFFAALLDQMEGNYLSAKDGYLALLREFPNDIGGVVNLSALYNDNSQFNDAINLVSAYSDKIESSEFSLAKFDAYFGVNDLEKAEKILLEIKDDFFSKPSYLERQAALKIQQKKPEEAIHILEGLISLNIGNRASIFSNLSAAYNKIGEYEKAHEHSKLACELNPTSWQSKLNQATSLISLERYSESKKILENLLKDGKRDQEILINMARVTGLLGEIESSMLFCEEGLKNNPVDVSLLTCVADNFSVLKKHEKAYEFFDKVFKLDPLNELANWHFALALLRDSKHRQGWEQYKWGFKRKSGGRGEYKFELSKEWTKNNPAKRLVVWGEQGIGDQLMFSKFLRYIPAEIKDIEFQIEARMVPLMKDRLVSRSGIQINAYTSDVNVEHIPVGNLPSILWDEFLSDPERRSPFLIRKYKRKSTAPIRVGITWRGGKTERMQSKRSVPLGLFPRIKTLSSENIKIIQLQYNPIETEINFLMKNFGNNLSLPKYDPTKELDLWVDHIDSCDLLISVDNSAVHFAGAMGIPTLTLTPSHADFRWGLSGKGNDWYDSVELLRDFSSVSLDELALEIDTWVHMQINLIRNR
jgi:tetratricopeptide (TPR) repeat protein